jgi:hypothetical protein
MRAAFETVARAAKGHGKAMGVGGVRQDFEFQSWLLRLGVLPDRRLRCRLHPQRRPHRREAVTRAEVVGSRYKLRVCPHSKAPQMIGKRLEPSLDRKEP